jgi:hypothetical protein
MRIARAQAALAALVIGWPMDALAQGCAMCRTALDGSTDSITQAFNASTLFLMAAPYTVVATVALWVFLTARRSSPNALDHGYGDGSSSSTEKETAL